MQLNLKFNNEIFHNGKKYRCIRKSKSETDFGEWEFYYPLNSKCWHPVKSLQIRKELNKIKC